jgi:hypothetical protein
VCSAHYLRRTPEAAKVRGVPTEVVATPRAEQQIAGLNRRQSKSFNDFLNDLAARGCRALAYRLSGPVPLDHMCVKHLSSSVRVVVAFESPQRAWILLVGRHDKALTVGTRGLRHCAVSGLAVPASSARTLMASAACAHGNRSR